MDYSNIMSDAVRIFNERNPQYGDMRIGMEKVASIASLLVGVHLTGHDVALVLHAVKLSRIGNDRGNPDHYVDGINYLAFAGELITEDPYGTETAISESINDHVETESSADQN